MICVEIILNAPPKMSSPEPGMEGPPTQSTARRRSQRIVARVALVINALDASPSTEWEHVETIVISLHGAMIRTRQKFPVGATLDIRMWQKDRSTQGRVVWTAGDASGKSFDVGFEILGPPGFWEINFPPDRREEGKRRGGQRP